MKKCAIIIPALNPTEALIEYVNELIHKGAKQIIVVNDGSLDECSSIFAKIESLPRCTVLTHEVNRGKGRALKTAFQYILKNHSDLHGVITADADGQHAIVDVVRVADALVKEDEALILGARDFSGAHVPFRSVLGNRSMNFLFHLLFRMKLQDTQTGLRGMTLKLLERFIHLKGERYEYEINMLIFARVQNVKMIEVPIQTLYFDRNSSSHYKAIKDSVKVCHRLLTGFVQSSSKKNPQLLADKMEGKTNEG